MGLGCQKMKTFTGRIVTVSDGKIEVSHCLNGDSFIIRATKILDLPNASKDRECNSPFPIGQLCSDLS